MNESVSISGLYAEAQRSMGELKAAIHALLSLGPRDGMTNSEIGKTLGIYQGHIGHEGHIPRTLLAIMEQEGVVEQDTGSKKWRIRSHTGSEDAH